MKKIVFTFLFLSVNSICLYANEKRFSGDPLPRFSSIKTNSVNTRVGPATTYPIKYKYKSRHQPVEIINEYFNWYQIKDIDGATSWIFKTYIGKNNYTVPIVNGTKLYAKPQTNSEVIAKINKGVILKTEYCDTFCKVSVSYNDNTFEGYIEKNYLWGMK